MSTRRTIFWQTATGVFWLSAVASVLAGVARADKRPNVVFVLTDDQGYGDLACHGNPIIQTPNMDRLYTQSVRLTDFHVDSVCAPTRAALMTGRYPYRSGVWQTIRGRSFLRKDEVTMADIFAAGGYRTAIFGKWHLGGNYPFQPQHRGFHEVLIYGKGNGGIGTTSDYLGNTRFDLILTHNGKPVKFKGFDTDVLFDRAMEFIEANKDRPFFVYLPTHAAHVPLTVPEKYSKLYQNQKAYRDRVKGARPRSKFYGMITNIDENLGRLMQRLKELGLEENTILIFMTDNGTATGVTRVLLDEKEFPTDGFNAGMRGMKASPYDGGHRVPCFIRWPAGGLKDGVDIDRLTAHIDLLPTLIELCGLKKPEGVKFDGVSLSPLLMGQVMGQTDNWPHRTLFTPRAGDELPTKWGTAVLTDRWRLVRGKELYDIEVDPGQKSDVADEHPEVVRRLRNAHERWWSDVSQRFDEYCEIIIGSEKERLTDLRCDDWHDCIGPLPGGQWWIFPGVASNGFWALDVARDGTYQFALRRWPAEVDKPITAAIPRGKAISASKARLKIADVDLTRPIPKDASAVTFQVQLKVGKTRLQTWFTDDKGTFRGAYYVYVKRLP